MKNILLPKAVFWDWDGTITDSYRFLNDAHNHTLAFLGFPPLDEGEYSKYFGEPRETIYPAIYKEKSEQAINVFSDYVLKNSHKVKTIDDVETILSFFYEKNITMGVVSNKRAVLIEKEIEHLGWGNYFSVLVGAGDAVKDKPSSAPLQLAIEKTGANLFPEEIWFIGDTENDLACSHGIGGHSIFLEGVENTEKLIEKYNPLISFENYSQLRDILVAI